MFQIGTVVATKVVIVDALATNVLLRVDIRVSAVFHLSTIAAFDYGNAGHIAEGLDIVGEVMPVRSLASLPGCPRVT